jgi:uncharacterized membrane protein YgaE (UPF0421/DUF939 family)
MRNIKTALTVFLCILISNMLNLNAFYASIGAVIAMQNTIENTFKTGLNRTVGTLIGATIGLLLSYLPLFHHIFMMSLGIVLVIYLTTLLKQKDAVTIACIVYLSIMLNLHQQTPLHYSLLRVFETTLGIILAVIINTYVCPPCNEKES